MPRTTVTTDPMPSVPVTGTISRCADVSTGSAGEERSGWRQAPYWPGLIFPLCGMLLALSAPGYGLWALAWVALIPALRHIHKQAERNQPRRQSFLGGFALGFAYHGLFCLWFFDLYPLSWLGFTELGSRLVTLAGWLLIAAEGGLLSGLLMLAYRVLKPGWLRMPAFPLLWVAGFALLNATPLALPWAMLEITQASLWPMRALMGMIGGSGVSALVVWHNAFWAEALAKRRFSGGLLVALIAPAVIGLLQMLPEPSGAVPPLPVALIDAALPIDVVRNPRANQALIADTYVMPVENAQLPPGTLLVYPEEGLVAGWVRMDAPGINPAFERLQTLAREKHLWIAVGVSALDASAGKPYNAIALIAPDRTPVQFYRKRRLVPFGEFTPYGLGNGLQQLLAGWGVDYTAPFAGEPSAPAPLLSAGKTRLGGLVCFEMIDGLPMMGGFAEKYRRQGANLLINASNLGWFHDNPLLEAQFLAFAQVRAAETRLPVLIASNTGHSVILAGGGRILRQTRPTPAVTGKGRVVLLKPPSR